MKKRVLRRPEHDPGRRRFLRSAAGGAAAVAVGGPALLAACNDDATAPGGSSEGEPAEGKEAEAPAERTRVDFYGKHQAGVLLRAPESGLVLAFDSQARSRDELRDAFRALSTEAQELMDGEPPEQRPPAFPPTDSGVFGDELPPSELSVVVGVGASLFDDRYGLASRQPRELVKMPFIANDRLDPAISHGDVSLTISASTADMTNYALRQLMRRTRGVVHVEVDARRLQHDPGRLRGRVRARSQPARLQGRHRQSGCNGREAHGRHRVGGARAQTSPTGPRAARTRRSASSGCSSSSGTGPA